jgi:LytR cell envelope-related transcriptional attenuator
VHLPLAFSIHHFISSVGADAGFAAIIGLAILVLLYFAQARETTTLRDEAISASQRVEQLERRVAQLGGPPVAPAPESATTAAPGAQGAPAGTAAAPGIPAGGMRAAPARAVANPVPAATPGAAAPVTGAGSQRAPLPSSSPARTPTPIPAAPAGVGAPALTDATRLIPGTAAAGNASSPGGLEAPGEAAAPPPASPEEKGAREGPTPEEGEVPAPREGEVPAPQEREAPAEQEREVPAPQEREAPTDQEREVPAPQQEAIRRPATPAAVATPPPATAAAGAGQSQTGQTSAPPVAANGGGEPRRARPAAAAGQPPPRINIRSDGAGASGPLSLRTRRGGNRWLPALIGVLLLAAIVAVLLVVTSGGSSSHSAAATRSTNAPAVTGAKNTFSPASVTVAVLNGTNVSQLAHRVDQKLKQAGYKGGTVATASDQTHTASIVAYLPSHQRDAAHVASSLGLGSGAVQQVDPSARAVACPPPAACSATVVVTVGSDLSSTR